jgi:hypothetical protein
MTTVVLTVITAWVALSILSTIACALVTRGGHAEDSRRQEAEADLALLLVTGEWSDVRRNRSPVG